MTSYTRSADTVRKCHLSRLYVVNQDARLRQTEVRPQHTTDLSATLDAATLARDVHLLHAAISEAKAAPALEALGVLIRTRTESFELFKCCIGGDPSMHSPLAI
eukprot:1476894-Amphidinium_carterae.1